MTIVYVQAGKEIPGDSWVGYVTASGHEVTTQPVNMTPQQMTLSGVTTVQQAPRPDEFYGPVAPDPNNPGQWIQTLYPPVELKPKLEQYSADRRHGYETGGVMIHPPTGGDYAASTTRDDRAVVDSAGAFLAQPANAGALATIKLMRIKTVNPPVYGNVLFVKGDVAKVREVLSAINKWSELCFAQENTLFTSIEAGSTTTKEQIDAAYLAMRTSAFPVAP
jgi:hypothetical protein